MDNCIVWFRRLDNNRAGSTSWRLSDKEKAKRETIDRFKEQGIDIVVTEVKLVKDILR